MKEQEGALLKQAKHFFEKKFLELTPRQVTNTVSATAHL